MNKFGSHQAAVTAFQLIHLNSLAAVNGILNSTTKYIMILSSKITEIFKIDV